MPHPVPRPTHPVAGFDVDADCLKARSDGRHGDMCAVAVFFSTGENRSMILALGVPAVIMCHSYFNSVVYMSIFRTPMLRFCPGCKHLRVRVYVLPTVVASDSTVLQLLSERSGVFFHGPCCTVKNAFTAQVSLEPYCCTDMLVVLH